MIDEQRVSGWMAVLKELSNLAGASEYSSVFPSAEVIDAAPADLPAGYIRVVGRSGCYEPALKVPGAIYHDGDYVILLYVKGTEAIALSQAPGSSGGGGGGGWPFTNILTVDSTSADADYATIADAVTVAVDGDLIDINSDTFIEDLTFVTTNVGLGCMGPRKAVIQGAISVGNGVDEIWRMLFHDFDISLSYASSVITVLAGIYCDGSSFNAYNINVGIQNSGTDDVAGFYVDGISPEAGYYYNVELHDCVSVASGSGNSYGVYVASGKVLIDSGRHMGDTAGLYVEAGATVELMEFPVLIGGTAIAGTGTVIGWWQDEDGEVHNGNTHIANRLVEVVRNPTADTAGESLTVNAGGATSGATNKAGGQLILAPGVSTGSGKTSVAIKRYTRGAAATTDNTKLDALLVSSEVDLANGSTTTIITCDLSLSGSMTGGVLEFIITCTDGADFQSYSGIVMFSAVNKSGTVTRTVTAGTSNSALSGGTLTVTWSVGYAFGDFTLNVNSNSSLTPTKHKIYYTLHLGGLKAVILN